MSNDALQALQVFVATIAPLFSPAIAKVVTETLAQREADEARLGGQLGHVEPEAAALVGVQPHVLRDCRRRGEIHAVLVGKRYVYSRDELLRFLRDGRAGS